VERGRCRGSAAGRAGAALGVEIEPRSPLPGCHGEPLAAGSCLHVRSLVMVASPTARSSSTGDWWFGSVAALQAMAMLCLRVCQDDFHAFAAYLVTISMHLPRIR